jgi:hypothetical protein
MRRRIENEFAARAAQAESQVGLFSKRPTDKPFIVPPLRKDVGPANRVIAAWERPSSITETSRT